MVPCQTLQLLIYIVLWNYTFGAKVKSPSFVRLPATLVYMRTHKFNIRTYVYVRIITCMYVH